MHDNENDMQSESVEFIPQAGSEQSSTMESESYATQVDPAMSTPTQGVSAQDVPTTQAVSAHTVSTQAVPTQSVSAQLPAQTVPVVAVVLAAGFGTRFDPDNPKQLVSVSDKPIVCWSIEAFEANVRVSDIVVVVNPQVRDEVERLIDEAGYPKVRMIINGGVERADSTAAALSALRDAGIPEQAKILIHDAVRPFVEQSAIDGCIDALDEFDAATVALASTDTILVAEDLGDRKVVRSVPDRANMFRAQTPQSFRFSTISRAYELASHDPNFHPTDDTRVVVDYLSDTPVAIVAGAQTNLKITTRDDLPDAENIALQIRKRVARERMHDVFRQVMQ